MRRLRVAKKASLMHSALMSSFHLQSQNSFSEARNPTDGTHDVESGRGARARPSSRLLQVAPLPSDQTSTGLPTDKCKENEICENSVSPGYTSSRSGTKWAMVRLITSGVRHFQSNRTLASKVPSTLRSFRGSSRQKSQKNSIGGTAHLRVGSNKVTPRLFKTTDLQMDPKKNFPILPQHNGGGLQSGPKIRTVDSTLMTLDNVDKNEDPERLQSSPSSHQGFYDNGVYLPAQTYSRNSFNLLSGSASQSASLPISPSQSASLPRVKKRGRLATLLLWREKGS
jgi:hypothetical protein